MVGMVSRLALQEDPADISGIRQNILQQFDDFLVDSRPSKHFHLNFITNLLQLAKAFLFIYFTFFQSTKITNE